MVLGFGRGAGLGYMGLDQEVEGLGFKFYCLGQSRASSNKGSEFSSIHVDILCRKPGSQ